MKYLIVLAAASLVASHSLASERDPAMLARKGKSAYAAFECAALASVAGYHGRDRELIRKGYEDGKAFLEAAAEGTITKSDMLESGSAGLFAGLDSPSIDFTLGKMSSVAVSTSTASMDTKDWAANVSRAKELYESRNCSLL